jgi:hypothetical protein
LGEKFHAPIHPGAPRTHLHPLTHPLLMHHCPLRCRRASCHQSLRRCPCRETSIHSCDAAEAGHLPPFPASPPGQLPPTPVSPLPPDTSLHSLCCLRIWPPWPSAQPSTPNPADRRIRLLIVLVATAGRRSLLQCCFHSAALFSYMCKGVFIICRFLYQFKSMFCHKA